MLLLLAACNTPPGAPSVVITPQDPLTGDDLAAAVEGEASDDQGDAVTYTYAWFVDGARRDDVSGSVVPADRTTRGETWKVVVTPSDGKAEGAAGEAEVLIGDTPPTVSLALDPLVPTAEDTVTVTASTDDADDDDVTVAWAWTRDGVNAGVADGTLAAGTTRRGEAWAVTATPSDDGAEGEPATVGFTVANAPPRLQSVSLGPTGATVSDAITATFAGADDADGDAVTVEVTWSVDGVTVYDETVDADGASTLAGVFARGAEIVATAVPNDGYDDGEPVVSDTLVVADSAPSVTGAHVDPDPLYVDSVATCVADGWADADGDTAGWSTTWTVNGVVVSTDATLPAGTFARGDTVSCTVVPDDGELEGAAVASADVVVSNSAPTCAAAAVTIGPDPATVADAFSVATDGYAGCADADGDTLSQAYDWRADGVTVGTGATLGSGLASRGQVVTLVTGWSDGTDVGASATSNAVTVANSPPTVDGVGLSPSTVETDTVVAAVVVATDLDGDDVSYRYAWTADGALVGTGATLDGAASFSKGQVLELTVTPNDGVDDGAPASASVIVANSAPEAPTVAILPTGAGDDDALVCGVAAAATDADGDALDYTFAWSVGGVAYPSATTTTFPGDTVPASATANGQTWTCSVTASDGTDTGPAGTAEVEVGCDLDEDGYDDVACGGTDCDDHDAGIHPDATEVCDAADVDEDCDGLSDDADDSLSATVYYPDADGDTYGDSSAGRAACSRPAGYITNGDDCDDTRASVKPGATERCDAADLDEDCDGLVDDADSSVTGRTSQYADADGDGYGDEGATAQLWCDLRSGYARTATDCDDADATVSPGASEVCADGIDNDCDDESYPCGLEGTGTSTDAFATYTGSSGFGYAVALGDFDGDGATDLLVGGGWLRAAYLWYGPVTAGSHASTTADVDLTGPSSWYSVAQYAAGIPDLDGDGDDELMLQATPVSTYPVYLIEGGSRLADTDLSTLASFGTTSINRPAFGGAGDMNGDGYADMFLGDVDAFGSRAADALTIYTGDPSGAYGEVTFTATDGSFGDAVQSLGDTDGDGLDDLVARHAPSSGDDGAYLIYGDAALTGTALTIASDAWFVTSGNLYVCAPGDVNDDGYADVGAGDTTMNLFLGPVGSSETTSTAWATLSGATACLAGDTDADGADETFFWSASGWASRYVHPMATGALGTADATLQNGTNALAVGDVTDDGYDDVVQSYATATAWVYTGGEW